MATLIIDPYQEITVEYIKDIQNQQIVEMRKLAYQTEADPLYFQYIRDEIDKQVWLDKVKEIRDRFPKKI